MTTQTGKTSEAPLAHGDVPEQDGSEDPGVGLESIRDAGGSADKRRSEQKHEQQHRRPDAANDAQAPKGRT